VHRELALEEVAVDVADDAALERALPAALLT